MQRWQRITPAMATQAPDWTDRSRELASLLARTGLGDRAAFAALYEHTSAQLFGVVLRIQRDRAQAEDVLQEVYVNVWRAASGFDAAQSQPLTWLTSVARNRAIDSLRRSRVQPQAAAAPAGVEEEDDPYAGLADEQAGPVELLQRACEARALTDCIQHLSASQRQSVALAFYDGLSHAEVAAQLRQPLGTVKSWLRRALQSLKNCLDRAAAGDAAVGGT
jgi:RNA polymerase sigma factor (sigma-70 family)